MSIFTPDPTDGHRLHCTICDLDVSRQRKEEHQEYHILGDMAIKPNYVLCPLCKTPISFKSYDKHLEGFHKMKNSKARVAKMVNEAEVEMKKREGNRVKMPKPAFKLPKNVQEQLQIQAEQKAMERDENRINHQVIDNFIQQYLPAQRIKKGRPRVLPEIEGETDEQRKARQNREAVQKFRDRERAKKGITGPKRLVKKQLQDGETVEDYDRRLHAERMKRYRAKLKEGKK